MNDKERDIIDMISKAVAEVTIETKAITYSKIKTVFEPLQSAIGHYKQSRFYDRMLLYSDPGNSYVSDEERKLFFDSLGEVHKDMLSSFIEKIYNADYELHVHLYKFLNERLIKNGALDYYDHTLFTNMEQFTSLDFETLWFQINHNKLELELFKEKPQIEFRLNKQIDTDVLSIKKFISLGLLQQSDIKAGSSDYGITTEISMSLDPTGFFMNQYMIEIFRVLDKSISETTKNKLIDDRKYNNTLDEW